jgi:hypothetical protein
MNKDIIERLERIETKLDNVIKALHEYDGDEEYGESSFEAFMDSKTNEGSHYVTNEEADEDAFNDYGQRVVGDKNNNNTQDKRVGEDKGKRRGGKKNKRKVDPIVQHQQFRQPHKH